MKKILLVTNLWGNFLSRRLGQSFMRIPLPRGAEKIRLLDAYFKKCGRALRQSEPLTPKKLSDAKSHLKHEQYNWLYLSVWLGLRPQEVDQSKDVRLIRLQRDMSAKRILKKLLRRCAQIMSLIPLEFLYSRMI